MIDHAALRWWRPTRRFGTALAPWLLPYTITAGPADATRPRTNVQILTRPARTWRVTGAASATLTLAIPVPGLVTGVYVTGGTIETLTVDVTPVVGAPVQDTWPVPREARTGRRNWFALFPPALTRNPIATLALTAATSAASIEVGSVALVYAPIWLTEFAPARPHRVIRRDPAELVELAGGGFEVNAEHAPYLEVLLDCALGRDRRVAVGRRELAAVQRTLPIDGLALYLEGLLPTARGTAQAHLVRRVAVDSIDETFAMTRQPTWTLREVA